MRSVLFGFPICSVILVVVYLLEVVDFESTDP